MGITVIQDVVAPIMITSISSTIDVAAKVDANAAKAVVVGLD